MLGVLPEREVLFDEEVGNYSFPEKQTLRLKKVMGYDRHRVVKSTTASSDLCVVGLNHMLQRGFVNLDEIGAVIVVTTTPDHQIPGVSNIIHGECGLDRNVVCIDVNQGCTAFLTGLMESFMLLEHLGAKKVLLFTVDTLSKKVSMRDRNSYPLIGDAAGITVVENDPGAKDVFCSLYNDGTRRDALIIPAGGSRLPCSQETAILRDTDQDGNLRSLDNLRMDGSEVFSFVQKDVPPLIEETLEYAGRKKEDVDWYLFHQPNKFMLKKLAEKIGVPYEKMPMNIVENYGNPSGSSIPVNIVHNLGPAVVESIYTCCLSAFGSGLAWGAMILELGRMKFCEMLISGC